MQSLRSMGVPFRGSEGGCGGEDWVQLRGTPLKDFSFLGGLFSSFGVPRKGCEKGLSNYVGLGARWAPWEDIVTNSWPKPPRNGVPNEVFFGDFSGMRRKSKNLSPASARA